MTNTPGSNGPSRRGVLTTSAFAALGAATFAHSKPMGRPNILWLVSEDNNPFIGAYGDKLAHTPNIDALAAQGILYRNMYCNAPVCAPSRFSILTGIPAESCAPAQHMTAKAVLPHVLKTYPELMRSSGYYCTNLYKTDYNCDVDPKAIWDVQGPEGHWRNAPKGKPFLCVINSGATHESQICEPVNGRVKPEQIRVPAFLPDTPGIRQDYATYYNLIEKMDAEIGNHLADLAADGLADDTIVFYYSDNGGVLPRSKRFCYEEGQRIAMVISVPPKWRHLTQDKPGSEVTSLVTVLDLAPTLLAIAGVQQPPHMVGKALLGGRTGSAQKLAFGCRDRMDERYDLIRTVTDGRWRYIRNYMPHLPWSQHISFQWIARGYQEWEAAHEAGQLTPKQDRFFQQKPYEELYNLSDDPDEVVNLMGQNETAAIAKRLSEALDAHMIAVNDNGFFAEGMAGEGFFPSRDRKIYPLPELMKLAAEAAQRNPRNADRFVGLLTNEVPAIRFWAVLGLNMLDNNSVNAQSALIKVMLADPVPQVRIAAAQIIAQQGSDEAVQILGTFAGKEQTPTIRLQALNALTYVGPSAKIVMPFIQEAAMETSFGSNVAACARYLVSILEGTYDPLKQGLSVQACQAQKTGARKFMG